MNVFRFRYLLLCISEMVDLAVGSVLVVLMWLHRNSSNLSAFAKSILPPPETRAWNWGNFSLRNKNALAMVNWRIPLCFAGIRMQCLQFKYSISRASSEISRDLVMSWLVFVLWMWWSTWPLTIVVRSIQFEINSLCNN